MPSPSEQVILGQYYTSEEVCDAMLRIARVDPEEDVLEAGCGEGAFVAAALRRGVSHVDAIDIDRRNCERVVARFGDRVSVVCADYVSAPSDRQYDLIIGNPPYVRWRNIDRSVQHELLNGEWWSGLANGEWDLMYAFLARNAARLRPGGRMVQIVPSSWLGSTYAQSLRSYLRRLGTFECMCFFGDLKLFDDCAPNCMIFSWRRGGDERDPMLVAECMSRRVRPVDALAELCDLIETGRKQRGVSWQADGKHWRSYAMAQPDGGGPWWVAPPERLARLAAFEAACDGTALADVASPIVGVVSGLEAAFTVTNELRERMTPRELVHVRTFVKSGSCAPYRLGQLGERLFLEDVASERDLEDLPVIREHLANFEPQLRARHLANGRAWWQFATPRNVGLFAEHANRGKLFVPFLDRSERPRFAYSARPAVATGDVVTVVGKSGAAVSVEFLAGWLNDERTNEWYRVKGARTGRRIRWSPSPLERIPVLTPRSARERALVERVEGLATAAARGETDAGQTRTAIGALVERLVAGRLP